MLVSFVFLKKNVYNIFLSCRYFTLFLNLLSRCVGEEGGNDTMEKKRQKSVLTYHDNLHQCTVAAMSNLLSANIDAGLTHAIGKQLSLRRRSGWFNSSIRYKLFFLGFSDPRKAPGCEKPQGLTPTGSETLMPVF